ncbi:MAG: tripartite tricarboxylate transporter substrate binding protein [Ottowia sp.]|uniref:Bug family tripartite tricarboxylate transporter substrate binding protein n=1 Tax=Ottowia sp. TaxID=1898956 RepID=UPI0039E58B10
MPRKTFVAVAFAALALPALSQGNPQANPEATKLLSSDKFTVVSPFPPGGPVDTLARVMAEGLSKRYGQPAVVDNAPGAAGNIGMDKVKRARPDGHTLLLIPAGNLTINPTLMPNFPFDIQKDFVAVTMLTKAPNVLVTSPASGIKSAKDLVAQAKAKPGTLSYASPGIGSGLHLAGELFKQHTGADLLHVAYKGTPPALNDVLGGVVPLMFTNLPAALPHLQSGKLVALGVTEAQRTPVAPDIPTLSEQGIQGVNVTSWYGMLAPAGTPAAVVAQLARDAADFLAQPDVQARLKAQGMAQNTMSPAAFDKYIQDETAVWAGVIKSRRIKAE